MTKLYSINVTKDSGEAKLGELAFAEDNTTTLTLDGSGPDHTLLKQRWEETSALPGIVVERRKRKKNDDGSWTSNTIIDQIGKESDEYPGAIVYHMDVTYGYHLYTLPVRDK